MSDFEKVAGVNAWMIHYLDFDMRLFKKGSVPATSYTAEGAIKTRVAVCEGYTRLFEEFMAYYNIPCNM